MREERERTSDVKKTNGCFWEDAERYRAAAATWDTFSQKPKRKEKIV